MAIAAKQRLDWLVLAIGVLRAGKTLIALNPGLSAESMRVTMADAHAELLAHDRDSASLCDFLAIPALSIDVTASRSGLIDSDVALPKSEPEDIAVVLFSSGTTGVPKAIERDHFSLITELLGWALELRLRSGTTFYIGRPVYYTGGLVLALSILLVGGCIVLNTYANDADFQGIWLDYQRSAALQPLDWAFFVPDQIRFFVRSRGSDIVAADRVLVMGGAISGDEKLAAAAALRSIVIESWGNTESLGTITTEEDLRLRPNSIGRPFLTDRMFVVDQSGNPLPPGTVGRLAGGQEAGFFQYANRPKETAEVKRNDLIISDDVGYEDEHGYFFHRGRLQDVVICRGESIFVSEREMLLRSRFPNLDCALVLAGASESPDVGVTLFIGSSADGLDAQTIQQILAPLTLVAVRSLGELPRLPSGKIDRVALTEVAKELAPES